MGLVMVIILALIAIYQVFYLGHTVEELKNIFYKPFEG